MKKKQIIITIGDSEKFQGIAVESFGLQPIDVIGILEVVKVQVANSIVGDSSSINNNIDMVKKS